MKIGIDIDNVISNFNDEILKEYIKHDKELWNTGIINENAESYHKGMFDWSNVDIMIDDSIKNCKDVSSKGTKVLLMDTRYNKITNEFERVSNWKEIYEKIQEMYSKE